MSDNGRITLSIIIVSAFDSIRLNQTLNSLPTIISGLEIVIVCPTNDVITRDLSVNFSAAATFPVRTVFDENRGIYPAMNLGIMDANGSYIMFWNSGDLCYSEENLAKFILFLRGTPSLWGVAQGEFSWRPSLELNLSNVKRFVFQKNGYISHQCVFAQKSTIVARSKLL
jgi:glycosyltransferase involved in cell wall biosynthesis